GSGVVEAFVAALHQHTGKSLVLVEYNEHALSQSAGADAICYVQLNIDGQRYCGVGKSSDIVEASLTAILGALNQAQLSAAGLAA
ncbi:MAG: alpha-isopropylmalate synthase regulatory domain-containing protein, partial [Pseudomonadales bacterium]